MKNVFAVKLTLRIFCCKKPHKNALWPYLRYQFSGRSCVLKWVTCQPANNPTGSSSKKINSRSSGRNLPERRNQVSTLQNTARDTANMATAKNVTLSWVPCSRTRLRSPERNPPPQATTGDFAKVRLVHTCSLSNGSRGYIGVMPTSVLRVRIAIGIPLSSARES